MCSAWRKEAQGGPYHSLQLPEGGYSQVWAGLFPQVTSDRTRGRRLKLHQGRFMLDIRENFITERLIKHWNKLPREVQSLYLEVLKICVDMV